MPWFRATSVRLYSTVERGGSAVECRTRNPESPGSNCLCYHFEVWAFLFPSRRPSSISCISEYLAKTVVEPWICECSRFISAWLECFPGKSSLCRNERGPSITSTECSTKQLAQTWSQQRCWNFKTLDDGPIQKLAQCVIQHRILAKRSERVNIFIPI